MENTHERKIICPACSKIFLCHRKMWLIVTDLLLNISINNSVNITVFLYYKNNICFYSLWHLTVIHVCALINNSQNKTNKCTNVEIIFLHTICHNSNMFQSILIISREFNIIKAYINYRWTITYIKICVENVCR
jgi:hypothetical protein